MFSPATEASGQGERCDEVVMVRIEFNGKPFDPATFEDALMAAAFEQVVEQIRSRVGSIRDPQTGEFPTVLISATSLSDMQLHVEGSDALIAHVRDVLGLADGVKAAGDDAHSEEIPAAATPPKVFLSYASEDRELAERIARSLIAYRIDTWWDEWEIRAGDSFRQKIDAGLGACTHFLVLLTPAALDKPWVNQEMDAGLVRMLNERIVFLPVRSGLATHALPPLLRGLHSPEIRDFDSDVRQLVHDIHGVTRKPPLGNPPRPVSDTSAQSEVSPAAAAIAKVFVEHTRNATGYDPQFSRAQLAALTGLTDEDLTDGLYELRALLKVHEYSGGGSMVVAQPELYASFDAQWQPWSPAGDALQLAADLQNDPQFPSAPEAIAQLYGWTPRRLNPALAYLIARALIDVRTSISDGTYLGHRVRATDNTRRFVKSRSPP